MKIKSQRILAIRQLISTCKVSSQEELLALLGEQGFQITQATLSRDLKSMKIGKVPDAEKGYCYVVPEEILRMDSDGYSDDFPMTGVETVEFSGNLTVIKTRPAFANGIASVIDSHGIYEILGTVAGDDTIILVNREGVSREDVLGALSLFIPGIKEKVIK